MQVVNFQNDNLKKGLKKYLINHFLIVFNNIVFLELWKVTYKSAKNIIFDIMTANLNVPELWRMLPMILIVLCTLKKYWTECVAWHFCYSYKEDIPVYSDSFNKIWK